MFVLKILILAVLCRPLSLVDIVLIAAVRCSRLGVFVLFLKLLLLKSVVGISLSLPLPIVMSVSPISLRNVLRIRLIFVKFLVSIVPMLLVLSKVSVIMSNTSIVLLVMIELGILSLLSMVLCGIVPIITLYSLGLL